ncbi:hypothetical protein CR152_06605 [Massilia violaceinigra]|uniref:Uncharacterized protein n=1 Tax=Massilia violaceinigra TaxID=2045208 RepID=A0A2D2DGV4_9BURK|nr:hypothetical protein CR152_06605 [Massilia violaceinigra]
MLDDTLDQAIRARQRRVMMADNLVVNLAALRVPDRSLDSLLQAAAMYGRDAVLQLDSRLATLNGPRKEAAVFLRIALAVQSGDPALCQLAATFHTEFRRAVLDGCAFYPVPGGTFSGNDDHIVQLFSFSSTVPALRPIALALAGMRDVKRLAAEIDALRDDPQWAGPAYLALTRMGAAPPDTSNFIEDALQSVSPAQVALAMDLIAADPRVISNEQLLQASARMDADTDNAWLIAACRAPRAVYERAAASTSIAYPLLLQISALTGYLDGVIRACHAIAATPGPITQLEADLLTLVLGELPVEARCAPNDGHAKSLALRNLLLRTCRNAHVPVCNDADICAWNVDEILANPQAAYGIRFRNGAPLTQQVPPLNSVVFEVSHTMRQALYIERATTAGHALALSAKDVTRRQELACMISEFADAMTEN